MWAPAATFSLTPTVCVKLLFDPHCLVSRWHWCSSCEQWADLMLLHNAERGSDRLHKPVIGSCSHRGALHALPPSRGRVGYSRGPSAWGSLSTIIIVTLCSHILPPAQGTCSTWQPGRQTSEQSPWRLMKVNPRGLCHRWLDGVHHLHVF